MTISKRHTVVRLLTVLLVLGMLAFLAVSCKTAAPANGTVTIKLTNATPQIGKLAMFGVFKEGLDPLGGVDEPDGYFMVFIASDIVQVTAKDLDTMTNDVIFTGGAKYFVAAGVDMDGSVDISSGDLIYQGPVFTVDGNMTVVLDLTSFTVYP
jgi:hypothetical protein